MFDRKYDLLLSSWFTAGYGMVFASDSLYLSPVTCSVRHYMDGLIHMYKEVNFLGLTEDIGNLIQMMCIYM